MKNLFIASCFLIIVACSPTYYAANTLNTPMISEKGESSITAAGKGGMYELHGGYGITDNLAVIGSGSVYAPKSLENGNGGSGFLAEAGVGYFNEFQENILFDVYGLLAFGSMNNQFPDNNEKISARAFRLGIQPGIGYMHKYFSASFNPRIAFLNFSGINGNLTYEGVDQVQYLTDNKNNFLLEPTITLRGGLEKIKLQLQYGYSLNMSNPDFKQDKNILTIGLNFRL